MALFAKLPKARLPFAGWVQAGGYKSGTASGDEPGTETVENAILMEDGGYILTEDGGILLQESVENAILTEEEAYMLSEESGVILQEL